MSREQQIKNLNDLAGEADKMVDALSNDVRPETMQAALRITLRLQRAVIALMLNDEGI